MTNSLVPVIPGASAVTMTSLELVDFVNGERKEAAIAAGQSFPSKGFAELRHDHFMAKVPEVLGVSAPKFLGTDFYVNGTGAKVSRNIYTFPKREACLMAMSYSYDLQAKVFDRMTALENQLVLPAAFDPASLTKLDILKLAMESEEGRLVAVAQVEKLAGALEQQAPKVAAFDRFATVVEGSMCLTNAAKTLQLQPKKFILWMQEHQWVYRRAGGSGLIGYQNRIQSGHMEHKVTTVARSDGTEKQVEQVLVTAKGLAKLATELGQQ